MSLVTEIKWHEWPKRSLPRNGTFLVLVDGNEIRSAYYDGEEWFGAKSFLSEQVFGVTHFARHGDITTKEEKK